MIDTVDPSVESLDVIHDRLMQLLGEIANSLRMSNEKLIELIGETDRAMQDRQEEKLLSEGHSRDCAFAMAHEDSGCKCGRARADVGGHLDKN